VSIGSLFSGIGGLELGLERAGHGPTIWQVEIDPFCRTVLAKHWPDAERFDDVRAVGVQNLAPVDVLCGGFPCQDVSQAGKGTPGLGGDRSGLWAEFARIIDEIRPRVVVVENVASGKARWLPQVRRDLHLLGYDSTAVSVAASDVGAPHLRHRVFVLGYAYGDRESALAVDGEASRVPGVASGLWNGWVSEPEFVRVDDGVPGWMDRLSALGNAVVPQCAEVIGRMIR
jgi:DNA (cytosine-5)-methyltransferase 1